MRINSVQALTHMKKVIILFLGIGFCCLHAGYAATVDTLNVKSDALGKASKAVVILPSGYDEGNARYPSVYILHGYSDHYATWVQKMPGLLEYADQYGMLIICPDGGYNSWYIDSPTKAGYQYETYITQELVPTIDAKYRTRKAKQYRAVTGHSMGGHGAMYLGIRHQALFGSIGCIAGGVDLTYNVKNWGIKDVLGDFSTYPQRWYASSVINLVNLLRGKDGPNIIIDCGYNDFFYGVNESLHAVLLEKGIPHVYSTRPGKHNWAYFPTALTYQLFFFHEIFGR